MCPRRREARRAEGRLVLMRSVMKGGNVEEVVDVVGVAGVAGNGSGEFALVGVCWGRETIIVSFNTETINNAIFSKQVGEVRIRAGFQLDAF